MEAAAEGEGEGVEGGGEGEEGEEDGAVEEGEAVEAGVRSGGDLDRHSLHSLHCSVVALLLSRLFGCRTFG